VADRQSPVMPRHPTAVEWTALIAEYEQSGLQQKEFCAKHDLSLSTFQYWLYRRSKRTSEPVAKLSESFVPFTVVGSAAPAARPKGEVEIAVGSGLTLRVATGTDPLYLAELLRVLR